LGKWYEFTIFEQDLIVSNVLAQLLHNGALLVLRKFF